MFGMADARLRPQFLGALATILLAIAPFSPPARPPKYFQTL